MDNLFLRLCAERPYLLADGATGTNLFAMGLESGDSPELWNHEHPQRIRTHYRRFIDAGADIILTNSFGGNRYRLALHQAQEQVVALNRAAAQLAAQEVADAQRPVVIAGSIGPTGELIQPTGSLAYEDAVEAFSEQAQALRDGGADVLWIETMSAAAEVHAAIQGCASAQLPIVYTASIDTNGHTMMGLGAAQVAALVAESQTPVQACGTNCGVGAAEVVAAMLAMRQSHPDTLLVAKANCGIPEWRDGAVRYNGTPELMSRYVHLALDAGAQIVGGCCGTTPEHIAAMRAAMDQHSAGAAPDVAMIESQLGPISEGLKRQLSGQPNPPERKRRTSRRRA